MRDPVSSQVPGPLASFAEEFHVRLERSGYARRSLAGHLRLMADLSRWLGERRLDSSGLSSEVVSEFVAGRRAAGHRDARSARSLRPLLEFLRELGVAPAVAAPLVVDPVGVLLADYASYLTGERGLAAVTVGREMDLVRPFLAARVVGDVLVLGSLTAGEVTAFMLARSRCVSTATVQRTGTALRSLLRFLHLRGVIDTSLVGAVPTAASSPDPGSGHSCGGPRVTPVRAGHDLCPSAAAHRGHHHARGRGVAGGDRAGAAPPARAVDGRLREGRSRTATRAGAALAG
jgi:hypothetical protein